MIRHWLPGLSLWIPLLAAAQAPQPFAVPNVHIERAGVVNAMVRQADGKLIVGGKFTAANTSSANSLTRFNADGSVDTTWTTGLGGAGAVLALTQDSSGRIYVAGDFDEVGGVTRHNIARLAADGSLDVGWDPNADHAVHALALDESNGVVFAGGDFNYVHSERHDGLARIDLAGNGSPDGAWTASANPVYALLVVGPSLFVGGSFGTVNGAGTLRLAKLSAAAPGTRDANWTPSASGDVYALAHDAAHDAVVVGGFFDTLSVYHRYGLGRISVATPAVVDAAWQPLTGLTVVRALGVDVAGSRLYFGTSTVVVSAAGASELARASLDDSGTVDPAWIPRVSGVYDLILSGDGGAIVGGEFPEVGDTPHESVARIDAAGALDPQFAARVTAAGFVESLVEQGQATYLGGTFTRADGYLHRGVLRLVDGVPDHAFQPNLGGPKVTFAETANPPAVYLGGSFYASGGLPHRSVVKVDVTTGALDPAFSLEVTGAWGIVTHLTPTDSGLIVAGRFDSAGGAPHAGLARVDVATGAVDPTWNPGVSGGWLWSFLPAASGGYYVGGDFKRVSGVDRPGIARLTADGAVDPSFDPGSTAAVSYRVESIATDATELAVYIGGYLAALDGFLRNGVMKLAGSNGHPDASWNAQIASNNVSIARIVVDGHGGVFLRSGTAFQIAGQPRFGLARVSAATGALDSTWNRLQAEQNFAIVPIALHAHGGIDLGGDFETVNGVPRTGFARMPVAVTQVDQAQSSVEPSTQGQPYTVSARASAAFATPTGVAMFDDGFGNSCGGALAPDGFASCDIAGGPAGTATITVTIAPDSEAFSTAQRTFTHTIVSVDLLADGFE